MDKDQLEEAIRNLCDRSGLGNADLAEVLDLLKVGYEMAAQEEC
jgi:hypothetical protein